MCILFHLRRLLSPRGFCLPTSHKRLGITLIDPSMHECSRSEVFLAFVVLYFCFLTTGLARATPVPPLASSAASSAAAPLSDVASSPATELLEPGEATELQGTSRSDLVADYDAKKFLQNYGYMPTYDPSKGKWEFMHRSKTIRQDTLAVTPVPVEVETAEADAEGADSEKVTSNTTGKNDSLAVEERSKFEQAIQSFQRRYKLQVTGSIDEETLRFMQQPRCGVPDYESKLDNKIDPNKVASTADLKGKLGTTTIGRSTSKATIGNNSGALGGTLRTKLSGGRSTVSSPVAKVATRTQDSTLSREATNASEPISVSDLLLKTSTPRLNGETSVGTTPRGTYKTTELTEIVTDIVTIEDEELVTTASPAPTTALTTATTPLLSEFDLPRSRRSVNDVLNDFHGSGVRRIRTKREFSYDGNVPGSIVGFNKDTITWRILTSYYSRHFSAADDVRSQIAQAFRRWAEVLPLKFVEMATGDILNVDIQIAFVDSTNSDDFDFNFMSEQLARSTSTRSIYFNDDIQWTYNSHQGKNMIKVAVHEVGHVLGLSHSDETNSVMYPYYIPFDPSDIHFRSYIDDESIQRAQAIHGACAGSFDTVLDWVRTVSNKRKYSSVFFRGDTMWVYENTNRRVKFGDPRHINDMWSGVPSNLDAAVQILSRTSDNLYFFKGSRYYQYDNVNRRVITRDPVTNEDISNGRLISEGWPAKPGFPRIPDDIDTAYYDKRDGNIYFFKGGQVYAFDMQEGGCCLNNYPMAISTAYPYRYASGGMPSNIDAAYYSIHNRTVFFLKGDTFWENETYNPSASTVVNRVGRSQQWNQHWYHICEA